MKDYSKILEASKRNSMQRIIGIGNDYQLTEWNILRLIEDMGERMRQRLEGIMDPNLETNVGGVKLELSEITGKGRRLMLKAQIYRVSNQELQLKVFAHEMLPEGKTSRVARAIYQLNISRSMSRGMVA